MTIVKCLLSAFLVYSTVALAGYSNCRQRPIAVDAKQRQLAILSLCSEGYIDVNAWSADLIIVDSTKQKEIRTTSLNVGSFDSAADPKKVEEQVSTLAAKSASDELPKSFTKISARPYTFEKTNAEISMGTNYKFKLPYTLNAETLELSFGVSKGKLTSAEIKVGASPARKLIWREAYPAFSIEPTVSIFSIPELGIIYGVLGNSWSGWFLTSIK